MWNEANLGQFWEGSSAEYVNTIAIPGAAAVRAACPSCVVVGPELANVGDADDYLEAVMTRAGNGTFDILSHHNYGAFAETGWHIWSGDGFINALEISSASRSRGARCGRCSTWWGGAARSL